MIKELAKKGYMYVTIFRSIIRFAMATGARSHVFSMHVHMKRWKRLQPKGYKPFINAGQMSKVQDAFQLIITDSTSGSFSLCLGPKMVSSAEVSSLGSTLFLPVLTKQQLG